MQTTEYTDADGQQRLMRETFSAADGNIDKLYDKMNQRLFALEEYGHRLVMQEILDGDASPPSKHRARGPTVTELVHLERAKKAQKKLNRLKRGNVCKA